MKKKVAGIIIAVVGIPLYSYASPPLDPLFTEVKLSNKQLEACLSAKITICETERERSRESYVRLDKGLTEEIHNLESVIQKALNELSETRNAWKDSVSLEIEFEEISEEFLVALDGRSPAELDIEKLAVVEEIASRGAVAKAKMVAINHANAVIDEKAQSLGAYIESAQYRLSEARILQTHCAANIELIDALASSVSPLDFAEVLVPLPDVPRAPKPDVVEVDQPTTYHPEQNRGPSDFIKELYHE